MTQPIKIIIITFFTILIFGGPILFAQQNHDIIVGSTFRINSTILNQDRNILISLPDSYNDSSKEKKKYPIMILLDGYTHFKTAAGIVHFMGSDSNGNRFIPETIIVAIENIDRERDFTVTKIKTKRPNTMGGGKNFLDFIEKELIPYIDKYYSTKTHRILAGHSLGGLLTLNAYMDQNSLFDAYISIDPSIWWDEQMMTDKVVAISPLAFKKRLYVATANQGEASYERNKKRHDTFYTLMKKRAAGPLNAKIEYFENESHRSVPLIALYEGLKYLYDENQ
jgi:predicted alpha/beta superfamily hydrolase